MCEVTYGSLGIGGLGIEHPTTLTLQSQVNKNYGFRVTGRKSATAAGGLPRLWLTTALPYCRQFAELGLRLPFVAMRRPIGLLRE